MIVRLNGGMCNQIFQWAFGKSVSLVRKELLFFEPQDLGKGSHRAYSLGAFNMDVNWANGMTGPDYTEKVFKFDPGVYTAAPDSFFKGCWQTEKYFNEPVVRKGLTLRKPIGDESQRVAEEILKGPSAFLHVRRTDYLTQNALRYHGSMSQDYYNNAIKYIRERKFGIQFFVFSDDPEWCRSAFPDFKIVGHNKGGSGDTGPGTEHEDLFLMGLCDHAIIANSSFSWIGAYIGDERRPRIVIGPEKWFVTKTLDSSDIMPDRWIKLS